MSRTERVSNIDISQDGVSWSDINAGEDEDDVNSLVYKTLPSFIDMDKIILKRGISPTQEYEDDAVQYETHGEARVDTLEAPEDIEEPSYFEWMDNIQHESAMPPPNYSIKADEAALYLQSLEASKMSHRQSQEDYVGNLVSFIAGIATLWRFPYLCYADHGGTFIVAYTTLIILIGLPMFLLESSIGQILGVSYLRAWRIVNPKLIGLGFSCMIICFLTANYYGVVVSWGSYYLLRSLFADLTGALPWMVGSTELNDASYDLARRFWFESVLHKGKSASDWDYEEWNLVLLACSVAAWVLTAVTTKYKAFLSKFWKLCVLATLLMYLIFFVRLLFLKGATRGFINLFIVDFDLLSSPQVWVNAVSQIFFSLGIGYGALINCTSFTNSSNPVIYDACIFLVGNWFTSVLVASVCFMTVGVMEHTTAMDFWTVAKAGIGAPFVMYSVLISTMPYPKIWGIIFWLVFYAMGINSLWNYIELIVEPLIEAMALNNDQRLKYAYASCACCCAMGAFYTSPNGIYLANATDNFTGSFTMINTTLVENVSILRDFGILEFSDIWGTLFTFKILAFLCTVVCPLALISVSICSVMVSTMPKYLSKRYAQAGGALVSNMDTAHDVSVDVKEKEAEAEAEGKILDDKKVEKVAASHLQKKMELGEGCGQEGDCGDGGECDHEWNFCRCDFGFGGMYCNQSLRIEHKGCPELCNNRGLCDFSTGICECYSGFRGDSCHGEVYANYWPGWTQSFGIAMTIIIFAPLALAFMSRRIRRIFEYIGSRPQAMVNSTCRAAKSLIKRMRPPKHKKKTTTTSFADTSQLQGKSDEHMVYIELEDSTSPCYEPDSTPLKYDPQTCDEDATGIGTDNLNQS
eukprot:GHVH01006793.1.p1 GENE.GHVH01006793.1~~GHVH01006793.1.p1  ORF type:complete len:863 (+),score=75.18 GHVH01006793.1:141-2729(+)